MPNASDATAASRAGVPPFPVVNDVLVVGGGSAGFLSALALKTKLPALNVRLVRSKNIPIIGVGESTTVALPKFLHDYLGVPFAEFFKTVRPSWKLGIRFEWGDAGRDYFNYAFDSSMAAKRPFFSWSDAYYCLHDDRRSTTLNCLMNQGLSPCSGQGGRYAMNPNFGYHLDAHLLVEYLETACADAGVELLEGDVSRISQAESGRVDRVELADGRTLQADLFVDCTGFRSLLLSQTLQVPFKSYANQLFCDKAWAGRFRRDGKILPYTTTSTMDGGWSWRIEFEDHVTRGYVFSSMFVDDDAAADELLRVCPELKQDGGDLRLLEFQRGRYESFWVGNVAAIGNASGFVEPLEATALHMVVEQLRGLCQSLVDCNRSIVPAMRDLQNRRFRVLWDDICSFLAVHYKFNFHRDTPFWRHCQNETDLTLASDFVEAYQQAGPSVWTSRLLPDSIFGFVGYLNMLIGQNVPTRFDRAALKPELPRWESHGRGIESAVKTALPVRESLQLVRSPNWPWPKTLRVRNNL